MNTLTYFPEGVALGDAFINREKEKSLLINRIKSNKHSVLIAPRRYGKTSLVIKIAEEMKIPYCSIDLLAAYSEEYVRDHLINKISQLVFELLPNMAKAKEIQSSEFTAPLKISTSSAQQSIEVLTHKDMVYQREDGFYCILDPAVKYYLDVILWENK